MEVIELDGDLEDEEEDGDENDDVDGDSNGFDILFEEFEVDKFFDICFGNFNGFKVEFVFYFKVYEFDYNLEFLLYINKIFIFCKM